MKIVLTVVGILILLFLVAQGVLAQSSNKIESYPYKVVQRFDGFEIRKYEARNFTYVSMPRSSYKSNSSTGFRMLAGYIFGNNERSEKIAMTSPVAMDMNEGDSMQMMFMIPADYTLDAMPAPGNQRVKFKTEPAKLVAAIEFGGWASDERLARYKRDLEQYLEREGVAHNGNFSFLGYNPPYQVLGRRNEVIVELVDAHFQE